MTLANFCGFSRIAISPAVFVLLTNWPDRFAFVAGVAIFAAITDILDGFFARRHNTVSDFGVFLDLTADKVFVSMFLLALLVEKLVPVGIVAVIFCREFMVMGVRAYAASKNVVIPAGNLGSLKTIFLFSGGIAVLFFPYLGLILLWSGTLLAVVSGSQYFISAFRLLAVSE